MPDDPLNTIDARTLNQAKSWMPTYHKKLHNFAQKHSKGRAEALDALSGRAVGANETGVVTIGASGAVQVVEAGHGDGGMKLVNLM